MPTLLDDLDPYGAQSRHGDGHDRMWRESTPDDAPASPIRLLDLSFLAAVTPRSPEPSALIDFSVSPPPPLYPSSKPSAHPDMAPVHLLDDSFAIESPIRVGSNSNNAAGPQAEEKDNRPLARPARKRWSVMTKLREEQQQELPRHSSPPVKNLSPFRAAGDASLFLSPSQLGVVDLSLIADEGASFLAVADTSETAALSRLNPVPRAKDENLSGDSSLVSQTGGGQSGGMSVLLRGLEGDAAATATRKEHVTGHDDPGLAQSSILPTTLTSSHRRALQQSVAHFESPPLLLNEATFSLDDPSSSRGGEEVTLLNCSTASFKDYRDSPRKPRLLLSTHTEDWSLEEEEEQEKGSSRPDGEDDGKTPRPPRRRYGRISDATSASSSSDGDSFRLDRFQTSGFGTGILNQSPPTAAFKPESTGTLRLELGLEGLVDALASPPPREASVSPSVSPVTELASSTRTVMASSRSSSRASTVVDLLGVNDTLARSSSSESETETARSKPPRVPVVAQSITATPTPATAAKAMSGAERLKRRLEELRAQKQQQTVSSDAAAASSTRTRASTTTPAATLASTSATPAAARRSFARTSLAPTAPPTTTTTTTTTTGRLARPRLSALPTSSTTAPPPQQTPATPGERKESTAARLERLRSERKERETIRSAGATTTATPGRAGGGGLVRSASLVAPRDRSLASLSSGGSSDARSGARLPSSQSLADLSTIAKQPAIASRRTSLLPAPAPASTTGRRTSLAPSSEVPRRRMSFAPESAAAPPARSSRQSLAPTSRDNGLDRSLPPSSSSFSAARTSVASIRRSSSLQQISEPVAGRRGSLVAPMKPNLASFAPAHDRTPFRSVQAQTPSSEMAASRDAPTVTSGIARAPSTRRLSRLARPSMGSLGPR